MTFRWRGVPRGALIIVLLVVMALTPTTTATATANLLFASQLDAVAVNAGGFNRAVNENCDGVNCVRDTDLGTALTYERDSQGTSGNCDGTTVSKLQVRFGGTNHTAIQYVNARFRSGLPQNGYSATMCVRAYLLDSSYATTTLAFEDQATLTDSYGAGFCCGVATAVRTQNVTLASATDAYGIEFQVRRHDGNSASVLTRLSIYDLELRGEADDPPGQVTGLSATAGDGQVSLSWTALPDVDLAAYTIFRGGAQVATTASTSYTDVGLTNGATYSYTVAARDNAGQWGANSTSASATPADATAPDAPSNLTATSGDGQVSLSWSASTAGDVAAYRIYRNGSLLTQLGTNLSFVDQAVANGVSYTYAIRAVDEVPNESNPSDTATATPADTTAPPAATNLTAVPGDGLVNLSWTASAAPDVASYRLYRNESLLASIGTNTTYQDLAVVNGATYTYAVRAVDEVPNIGPTSANATAMPADTTAPGAPSGLTATGGMGQVSLAWTAPGDQDVVAYRIYRGGAQLAQIGANTTYQDAGLAPSTAYSYEVAALDEAGNLGLRSAAANATTDPAPAEPAPPPEASASVGSWNHEVAPSLLRAVGAGLVIVIILACLVAAGVLRQ